MSIVYSINKGINKPLEFKGIKAQYIVYLAIGLVLLMLVFAVFYVCGISLFISIPTVGILGMALFNFVMHFSSKYGQHGLVKEFAYRRIPPTIQCLDRSLFISLTQNCRS
ncbi:DUF4133 domain-containing protein [Chitinophaga sp. NPDC101104]|uniref:DUF4133 domain-containing protein n=1 Tax=Chitinophaga sp. NPDC101104 TaxID=3390561 RepID=UPI003CFC25F5